MGSVFISIFYSTISFFAHILWINASDCLGIGTCNIGTKLYQMSYNDSGYCDYLHDCPRFYISSSISNLKYSNILTYQGESISFHMAEEYHGNYQRPALFQHELSVYAY